MKDKEKVYILHHTKGLTDCKQHLLLRTTYWVKDYIFLGISWNKLLKVFEWKFQVCSLSSFYFPLSTSLAFFFNPPCFFFPSSFTFFPLILHKCLYCLLLPFSCLAIPSPLKKTKTANIIPTGKQVVVMKKMERGWMDMRKAHCIKSLKN